MLMGVKQVLMGVLCYAGVVWSQGLMGVRWPSQPIQA